jgi:hypothetical protein
VPYQVARRRHAGHFAVFSDGNTALHHSHDRPRPLHRRSAGRVVSPLSREQRQLYGRMGALSVHARGKTNTAPPRAAFDARFEREVDPDGVLTRSNEPRELSTPGSSISPGRRQSQPRHGRRSADPAAIQGSPLHVKKITISGHVRRRNREAPLKLQGLTSSSDRPRTASSQHNGRKAVTLYTAGHNVAHLTVVWVTDNGMTMD